MRRWAGLVAGLLLVVAGPGWGRAQGVVSAVGVENEYADVIGQVGGRFVAVRAIETDPNTDPHTFEVSPRVAGTLAGGGVGGAERGRLRFVGGADGGGEPEGGAAGDRRAASAGAAGRDGEPASLVRAGDDAEGRGCDRGGAGGAAAGAGGVFPGQCGAVRGFVAALGGGVGIVQGAVRGGGGGGDGAVADYMLQAAGCVIATPFTLQAAIMNGTDPSPQDVTRQEALLSGHKVRVLVYNEQVTDSLTQAFLQIARKNGVPVVGVYETMPTPGFDYQSWMVAEVAALRRAVGDGQSTERLEGAR